MFDRPETARMNDSDFLVAVRMKRADQMETHGIRTDYSIIRWGSIINCEIGKLNHAIEDLYRSQLRGRKGDGDLRIRIQEQVFESAACMLAMLQESPIFNSESGLVTESGV